MGNSPLGAEALKKTHASWAAGDVATLNAGIADDIAVRHESAPSLPLTGIYAGKDGWNEWLKNLTMTNHFQDIQFYDYGGSKNSASCKVASNIVNKKTGGVVKGAKSLQSLTLDPATKKFTSCDLVDYDIADLEKAATTQMCLSRTELALKEGTKDQMMEALEGLVFSRKMMDVDGMMGVIVSVIDETHVLAYGVYESQAACVAAAPVYGEIMKDTFGAFLAGPPNRQLHKAVMVATKGMTGRDQCVARTVLKVKEECRQGFEALWAKNLDDMLRGSPIEAMGYVELTAGAAAAEGKSEGKSEATDEATDEAKDAGGAGADTFDIEILAVYPSLEAKESNAKLVAAKLGEAKDMLAAAPDRSAYPESFVHLGNDGCVVLSEVTFDTKANAAKWVKIMQSRPDPNEIFGDSLMIRAKPGDETGTVYEWNTLTTSRTWLKIDAHNKARMATSAEMKEFFAAMAKMEIKCFGKLSAEAIASMQSWAQDPRITVSFPEVTTALTKYSAIPQRNAFYHSGFITCKDAERAQLYAKHVKAVGAKHKGDGVFVVFPVSETQFQWIEVNHCDTWVNKENKSFQSYPGVAEFIGCIESFDSDLVGDLTQDALAATKQWQSQPWCNITINGDHIVKGNVNY